MLERKLRSRRGNSWSKLDKNFSESFIESKHDRRLLLELFHFPSLGLLRFILKAMRGILDTSYGYLRLNYRSDFALELEDLELLVVTKSSLICCVIEISGCDWGKLKVKVLSDKGVFNCYSLNTKSHLKRKYAGQEYNRKCS